MDEDKSTKRQIETIIQSLLALDETKSKKNPISFEIKVYVGGSSTLLIAITPSINGHKIDLHPLPAPSGCELDYWLKALQEKCDTALNVSSDENILPVNEHTAFLDKKGVSDKERTEYLNTLIASQIEKLGQEEGILIAYIKAQAQNLNHPAKNILALLEQLPHATIIDNRAGWGEKKVAIKDTNHPAILFNIRANHSNGQFSRFYDISHTTAPAVRGAPPHIKHFVDSIINRMNVRLAHYEKGVHAHRVLTYLAEKNTLVLDLAAEKNALALQVAGFATERIALAVADLPQNMLSPVSIISAMIFVSAFHFSINPIVLQEMEAFLRTLDGEEKRKVLELSRQLANEIIQEWGSEINESNDEK